MALPPIRTHHWAHPSFSAMRRVERLAERLTAEQPRLAFPPEFEHLRARRLQDAPTLHLDDFSGITVPEAYGSIAFLEDRARLRAGDGDLVVTRIEPVEGYEAYCRDRLGLGEVRWLRAHAPTKHGQLAASCWTDASLRQVLRSSDFHFVHPHMGSFTVWAMADLLARSSRRRLAVIGPPPELCRLTNNKLWVAWVVSRLLGPEMIPRTHSVANFSTLARVVRELAADSSRLVIKLTDGVGGGGNLVFDAARFQGLELGEIRTCLKQELARLDWNGETRILVGCWETDVLAAPSVQVWIPPVELGKPCVEGVFDQVITGQEGLFVGTRPARLPEDVTQELVDCCWLVARLFQRLGYVGRCSFDLILVGPDLASCRPELVECNARWGGTSLPMTLMSRLLGDWKSKPFACFDCPLPRPRSTPPHFMFQRLLERLDGDLYDARTGEGNLILYNPSALRHLEISVLGMGEEYWADPRRIQKTLAGAGLAASAA